MATVSGSGGSDFVAGIESGVPAQPDFSCAMDTQRVCDAVIESARTAAWVETGLEI